MDIYGNKLVNMIETKPLCISLSYLADMLTLAVLWPNILGHEIMLLWTAAQYIGFVMAAIATAPQALETLL